MRSVIIVTTFFIILIACTTANSIFILTGVSSLCEALKDLPEVDAHNCLDQLQYLDKKWSEFKKIAALTLPYSEINKISHCISELYVHLYNNNDIDFDSTRATLNNALTDLSRTEKLSFESIF